MSDSLFNYITLGISFLSLIVAIIVAWKTRKSLNVDFSPNLEFAEGGTVFMIDRNGEPLPYDDAVIATIEIVNPSQSDIAFFDLRAFNPETNINLSLLTKRTQIDEHRNQTLWRFIEMPNDPENIRRHEVLIPETTYGILKSNSFTKFNIVIFPKDGVQYVNLAFKVAMKAKIKDQFAVTSRKKFRFYGITYDITGLEELKQQSKYREQ